MTFEVMMGLSVMLGACGALLLAPVLLAAFRSSWKTGVLSLVVPGYVLFWGLRRMKHARRTLFVGGALGCFALAGLAGFFSTSFEPNVTLASENGGGDLDDFGDFDDDFDDFDDDFEDLDPPAPE